MTGYQNRHIPFISQSLYGITHLCNSLGIKPIDRFIKDQEIRLPRPVPARFRDAASFQGKKCFVFFFPTPSSPTVSKISSMYPFFRIPNNSHFIFRFVYAFMLPYSPGASIRHPTTRTNPLQFFSFTPEHLNLSGCRSCKSTDHLQASRLSRTVPSDKSIDSTLFFM